MAGFDNDTMFAQVGSDVGVFPNTTSSDNSTEFSRSGSDVMGIINNTSSDADSGARHTMRVETSGAGDPFLKFQVAEETSFSVGIDNSDSDLFKINRNTSSAVSPSTGTNLFNMGPLVAIYDLQQLQVRHERIGNGVGLENINLATTDGQSSARTTTLAMSATADAYDLFITSDPTPGLHAWNVGVKGDPDGDLQWRTPVNAGIPEINGTIRMNMTIDGEITFPTNPAFLAFNSVNDLNVTGDGTTFTVIFDSEVFDQGSNFDGTSTFTAPVTGRYTFQYNVSVQGLVAGNTGCNYRLNTSNRIYRSDSLNVGLVRHVAAANNYIFKGSCTADMDAADTAVVEVRVDAGALVTDVSGAAVLVTYFSGELAC